MKVIVSGSRKCYTPEIVKNRLSMLPKEELVVVHGAARGVDSIAQEWCIENNVLAVPYPANWGKYGRAAGPIRNREMLKENPDLVIAFPCPESKGTRDMINAAKEAGFMTEVIELGDNNESGN